MLQALCAETDREALVSAFFRHTTTLGLRESRCRRHVLTRRIETATLPDGGTIRRKIAEGRDVRRAKLEHEDLARLARENGLSLWEARERANGLYGN